MEGVFNPINSEINAGVAQLVERDLAKVEVVGSYPITRSMSKRYSYSL